MNGVAVQLVEWLAAYTYPVVFVGTLIDASGLPFPGRLLLIAAGAIAAAGRRDVAVVIVAGIVAAMMMDAVWYYAGTRGSSISTSSRRSGHMPERDRPPSASCAWTVETST